MVTSVLHRDPPKSQDGPSRSSLTMVKKASAYEHAEFCNDTGLFEDASEMRLLFHRCNAAAIFHLLRPAARPY